MFWQRLFLSFPLYYNVKMSHPKRQDKLGNLLYNNNGPDMS